MQHDILKSIIKKKLSWDYHLWLEEVLGKYAMSEEIKRVFWAFSKVSKGHGTLSDCSNVGIFLRAGLYVDNRQ